MDRKRFIKQLQAQGIQRNKAAQLAATTRKKGASYFKGLGIFLNTYAIFVNYGTDATAPSAHPWFYSAPLMEWQGRGAA